MRKKILTVYLLSIIFTHLNAQAGNDFNKDVDNINKIFPAAPTSNNLMKFEEVPVSYYTGIPDINIPLFNIPTGSPNVTLNVQLKYHPLSAKPEDKASETGLGWSLLAGGTITRTVRGGVADGKTESTFMSSPPTAKYGIYKHDLNPTYKLIFDQLNNWNINEYAFYAGIGKYDTEYDLYQYNFMGYSGRFIIKRDPNGSFLAEKLDRNNLKITSTHDAGGEVQTITITDDKGTRYLFRGMETFSKDVTTVKIGLVNGGGDVAANPGGGVYFSAYHLEKVQDPGNNVLLTFNYGQTSQVEYKDPETKTTRLTKNVIYNYANTTQDPDPQMPGAIESQTVFNKATTKLLTSITITDRGTINFTYEKGRNDSNYLNSPELYKLKSVQSNINGQNANQYVDKYFFDYDYSNSILDKPTYPTENLRKLLLKKVIKSNVGGNLNEYTIAYNNINNTFEKDSWGYYKGSGPSDITQDVIKSITYPTKGKVVFDFGENVYSHFAGFTLPMEQVTGSWEEEDKSFDLSGLDSFSSTAKAEFFTINSPQKVKLHLELGDLMYSNWNLKIYKKLPNNTFSQPVFEIGLGYQLCISTGGPQCPGGGVGIDPIFEFNRETDELEQGTYYASLTGSYGPTHKPVSYGFSAYTKEPYFKSYVTKKGGGLRINNIQYFDTSPSAIPSKEFTYDYTDIDNPQKSSGALVFPEPVFKYSEGITYNYADFGATMYYSCQSDTTTNFNIIPTEKTQGSDVGYKYVTVKQIVRENNNGITDNGKTVYKFRSPIDFPNPEVFFPQVPVLPIINHDYLRGQILFEKKYDSDGKILSEVSNEYSSIVFEKLEGIKAKDNFYNNIDPSRYKYKNYVAFQNYYPQTILVTPYKYFTQYGITLPIQKTETSYFYKNGVQSSVTSNSNSTYNSLDYLSLSTQVLPDGSSTMTNYLYAYEKNNQKLINANMIGFPLETTVVKKENTAASAKTLSKTETKYDNPAHLFPTSVLSYDLQTGNPSTEVTYDLYDSKGNLQQYTTKNGISTVIIWGYNKTQPIAKIEGAKLSDIQQSLIDAIVNASDVDALAGANNDETALFTAFKSFRNSLPNYQITTYTYDPLIGVRSITPPSGIRESYIYDSANRLEKVIDVNGKVLKAFKYNYKN